MKKIVTAILTLALLAALSTAFAGSAGTSADPLVSRSYVDGTYTDEVIDEGEALIDERIKELSGEEGKEDFAAGYVPLVAAKGSSVTLKTGSSIIVTKGSMTVNIKSGALIDISSGTEVASGKKLDVNVRYFCAEDTEAEFTASGAVALTVNGAYVPSDGVAERFVKYSDVRGTEWYYDSAIYVYENKLFPDWDKSSLRPNVAATRAETVYALWKALGSPQSPVKAGFKDLTEDWYKDAVNWSVENGIVEGYEEDNTFRPNDTLTREQLAVIMYRYTRYTGGNINQSADLSIFTDASKIGRWARTEVSWAVASGMMDGMSDGTMAPKDATTRAQVATILMRHVTAKS